MIAVMLQHILSPYSQKAPAPYINKLSYPATSTQTPQVSLCLNTKLRRMLVLLFALWEQYLHFFVALLIRLWINQYFVNKW